MLSILQVSTFFTEHGGVEKSVSDLAFALAENHSVRVLCTTRGQSTTRLQGNLHVTAVGGTVALAGRPIALSFPRQMQEQRIDVAHYHLPCPMAVLSFAIARPKAKINIATWHHDLVRHQLFNQLMRPLTERFLDSMDSILITAPAQLESTPILRRYRDKCRVVPLGIDEQRFSSIDHNAILDVRAQYGSPLILYVGRLVYYKGCDFLVKAMKEVPRANLLMIGDGPLKNDLLDLIAKENLSDRVHLVGRQPESVLRAAFQACDAFVLPSTLPTECFGLVQVEAMLCGKPVINTNLATGVPWVSVHSETGLTVEPADVSQLAHAINLLIDDTEFRHRLGLNAQRRARAMFTLKTQVASTVSHYEELLAKTGLQSRVEAVARGR